MYPSWLQVEYATTFLRSNWTSPIDAANNVVNDPIKSTIAELESKDSNI